MFCYSQGDGAGGLILVDRGGVSCQVHFRRKGGASRIASACMLSEALFAMQA
jgi:hypothetical protein